MITENNIKNLEMITSNFANKNWYNANKNSARVKYGRFTPSRKEGNWNKYSLSSETLEAYELLKKTIKKDISKEDEEEIKSYLLRIKMTRSELLKDIRVIIIEFIVALFC